MHSETADEEATESRQASHVDPADGGHVPDGQADPPAPSAETSLTRWGQTAFRLSLVGGTCLLAIGAVGDVLGLPGVSSASATVAFGVLVTLLGAGGLLAVLWNLRSPAA